MLSYLSIRLVILALILNSVTGLSISTNGLRGTSTEDQSYVKNDYLLQKRDPSPRDLADAAHLLSTIFARLHSYINETSFDHHRFAHDYTSLKYNITRGQILTRHITDPENALVYLLNFASQYLGVMRAAHNHMLQAENQNGQGSYFCLLYDASELRVMTLDMFNDRRLLSMSPERFSARIRQFTTRAEELEHEFNSYARIPSGVRMTTWNEIMHTNRLLQALQSRYLP